jgi:hypothetical protein
MRIEEIAFDVAREPLVRPFAFKGGAFTEKWLTVSAGRTAAGVSAAGLGSLAVLWSDPTLFAAHSETGGNLVMALIAEHGLQLLRGREITCPVDAIREILPEVVAYSVEVTGLEHLRRTVALNSLISADNLLWNLTAAEKGADGFDEMLGDAYRAVLQERQERLVRLPAVTYTYPLEDLVSQADSGGLLPKIKIGHPGEPQEMLAKDCRRLREIHAALAGAPASYSESGTLMYTLDANGRYDSPDTFRRLLDDLAVSGMLEHVLLIEEPYAEEDDFEVGDVPVPIAADECLHGVDDVVRRVALGYDIITLKAAGKTLSMSLDMAVAAREQGVPCIVADSCCVPLLLGWNVNLAARLPSLPGMRCGILESNGPDSYLNWDAMVGSHPCAGAGWLEARDGYFELGEAFYASSGGIFAPPDPYAGLVSV